MRKHFFILVTLLFFPIHVYGQIEEPTDVRIPSECFMKDPPNYIKCVSEDSTIFLLSYTPSRICKIFDKNSKLLAEGEITNTCVDCLGKHGIWTEYHDNNKIKSTGAFYWDKPIGIWQFYYPNGQLKETYSITQIETDSVSRYCITGSYQFYYENGQLKENGFYKVGMGNDTTQIVNPEPPYLTYETIRRAPVSKKFGTWTYYKQNGEIERKEEFNDGRRSTVGGR